MATERADDVEWYGLSASRCLLSNLPGAALQQTNENYLGHEKWDKYVATPPLFVRNEGSRNDKVVESTRGWAERARRELIRGDL